ncbi:MAG: IclR family transcriptional regulator [Actinomycetota bacterium]|nr:IclR family transcriptional regulator [Actinomycetota bacterium]
MSELVNGTQAVDRASALLIHILEASTPPILSQLSRGHEIPKSTTSRILSALERADLVRRDRDGAFIAGDVLTQFARLQNCDSVLVVRMRSVLEKLALSTGETANLAIASNGEMRLIDQVDSHYLLGATNWVGKRIPYHASALGKVFLAYGAATIPSGKLERLTSKTITTRPRLLIELEGVRKKGYATTSNELEEGLIAVAAPIREDDGRVVGAISISGPSARLTARDLAKIGEVIIHEINSHQINHDGKIGAA